MACRVRRNKWNCPVSLQILYLPTCPDVPHGSVLTCANSHAQLRRALGRHLLSTFQQPCSGKLQQTCPSFTSSFSFCEHWSNLISTPTFFSTCQPHRVFPSSHPSSTMSSNFHSLSKLILERFFYSNYLYLLILKLFLNLLSPHYTPKPLFERYQWPQIQKSVLCPQVF